MIGAGQAILVALQFEERDLLRRWATNTAIYRRGVDVVTVAARRT